MRKTIITAGIVLLLAGTLTAAETEPGITLISSSRQECVFSFIPENIKIDTLLSGGREWQRLILPGASFQAEAGQPLLPFRQVLVALPQGARPEVSVEAEGPREWQHINLAPAPRLSNDEFGGEVYEEGPAYGSSDPVPASLYRVEDPASFGGMRVVRINLYPARYLPLQRKLTVYNRLLVRVRFSGGEAGQATAVSPGRILSRVESRLLVNPGLAAAAVEERTPSANISKRVLTGGERFSFPVSQEGLYCLTGADLEAEDINLSAIDPATLKICNNGGRELPRDLNAPRPDSLIEIPILLQDGGDGSFDRDDCLYFYGRGCEDLEWDGAQGRYTHYINRYTRKNIYWLIFNDGRNGQRVQTGPQADPAGIQALQSFRETVFIERDLIDPLGAGMLWYDTQFRLNTPTETFSLNLPDPQPQDTVRFYLSCAGGTSGTHRFTLSLNGLSLGDLVYGGITQSTGRLDWPGNLQDGSNTLRLVYSYGGFSQEPYAYSDWLEVSYRRGLQAEDGLLRFFSPAKAGTHAYRLAGFSSEPLVLDVTDPAAAERLTPQSDGASWVFARQEAGGEPRRYLAADRNQALAVTGLVQRENAGLRSSQPGWDVIILTHVDFLDQAQRLSVHRQSQDSLTAEVVDVQDVYDEFAGGMFDPVAIRDFLRYAAGNWTKPPGYLVLFGDGDYDYRDLVTEPGGNWIPPFEYDGTSSSGSRASDDWYTYISGNDYLMDLSVGRLTVRSSAQAKTVVDKIISYETDPQPGFWKGLYTFVGDDEKAGGGTGNEVNHIIASEYIAEKVIPSRFAIDKIYLTEYATEITGDGLRKPQAREDLINHINEGTIFVNYIGHGNQKLWAHEWIFYRDRDLEELTNLSTLPVFYAATCLFGWYDRLGEESFAEELLTSEEGGCVAIIASDRLCSAIYNEALNTSFHEELVDAAGPSQRLGDALRLAKAVSGSRSNNETYQLLGDPCLRLTIPAGAATFTDVSPDTFQALGLVQAAGSTESGFSGEMRLLASDARKKKSYTTAYGTEIHYILNGNTLYRGEAEVDNGVFSFSFVVPKDISYGGEDAGLRCYYWNGQTDGSGYLGDIPVGGTSGLVDSKGPEIEMGFSGRDLFVSGDLVQLPAVLDVQLEDDKTGINLAGEIGHTITLQLDGGDEENITDYFSYDKGSYLKGSLHYALPDLSEAEHSIRLKAWDNANNSSAAVLDFRVVPAGELRLERVLNYPNPVTDNTHFTFYLSVDAEVTIKIFSVSGALIRTIEAMGEAGFNMIPWDGRDELGDQIANGVYLYKVTARASSGEKTLRSEVIERLMMMR